MARSSKHRAGKAGRTGSAHTKATGPKRHRVVLASLLVACSALVGMLSLIQRHDTSPSRGFSMLPMAAAVEPARQASVSLRSPLARGQWSSIVLHHSGSIAGSPASLDAQSRSQGLKGLGYHFVIGNGNGLDDGELYIGPRWLDQVAGAHVAGERADEWNRSAVGVCLVGDGRRRDFTDRQMAELVSLVAELCRDLQIPKDRVYLHRDLTRTEDPGRRFPEAAFREQLARR